MAFKCSTALLKIAQIEFLEAAPLNPKPCQFIEVYKLCVADQNRVFMRYSSFLRPLPIDKEPFFAEAFDILVFPGPRKSDVLGFYRRVVGNADVHIRP